MLNPVCEDDAAALCDARHQTCNRCRYSLEKFYPRRLHPAGPTQRGCHEAMPATAGPTDKMYSTKRSCHNKQAAPSPWWNSLWPSRGQCCDATLASPLTQSGHPQPCTAVVDGAALNLAALQLAIVGQTCRRSARHENHARRSAETLAAIRRERDQVSHALMPRLPWAGYTPS